MADIVVFSSIGTLVFDAVLRAQHTADADVTVHPVEVGSDISDNVGPKPEEITITGIVTDFPVVLDSSRLPASASRARDAYDVLRGFKNTATILRVVEGGEGGEVYENMVIAGLGKLRDAKTASAPEITVKLRQIQVVNTLLVQLPTPKAPRVKAAVKSDVATDAANSPPVQSIAVQSINAIDQAKAFFKSIGVAPFAGPR